MRRSLILTGVLLLLAAVVAYVLFETKSSHATGNKTPESDQAEVDMRAAVMNALKDYHGDCDNPLPVQARLSALFREWGSRDFEAALAFLESQEALEMLTHPEIDPRAKLRYATLVGHSHHNPKDAWARLLDEIYDGDVIILNTGPPRTHEVAAEEIFRNWLRLAPDEAMEALRGMNGGMMSHALRVVMEQTSGASDRKALYEELKSKSGNSIVLAGVCEQDPKQAWELMAFVDDGQILTTDSPLVHARGMFAYWAEKHPIATRQFMASLDDWDLVKILLIEYLAEQGRRGPELFVETLEMKPFDALQPNFQVGTAVMMIMGGRFDWPLCPEDKLPPSLSVCLSRLEKAVKNSGLNSTMKHEFETAVAKQRDQLERRETCGH